LPVHLIKLAVGCLSLDDLRQRQSLRAREAPPLRHQTRNAPKRAAEILDGGSIYWVINRAVVVRQRIIGIRPDVWDDGSKCTGLVLDPVLVRVAARAMKPFQGWRCWTAGDGRADVAAGQAGVGDVLPEKLRRELAALALL